MGIVETLLFGMGGGFAAEMVGLWKLRHSSRSELPDFLKSPFYWMVTVVMIGVGGGLAVLYVKSGASLNPFLAANVGASAPLIIGLFVEQTPPIRPGRID